MKFNMPKLPIDLEKNKTQVLITVILVSAIALFLYFNFLLLPQIGRVADLLNKTSKVSIDLRKAKADIAKIPEFKKAIDSYKEKVDSYETKLPVENEIPVLLESLSNMANNSRVKIIGITPMTVSAFQKDQKVQSKEKERIYKEIPILVSAKSGYHELGAFLNDLENSDRFMKVADIDMKANKASPKKHDAELIILTYVLLEGK